MSEARQAGQGPERKLPYARMRLEQAGEYPVGRHGNLRVYLNDEDITRGLCGLKIEAGVKRPTVVTLQMYAYVETDIAALVELERVYGEQRQRQEPGGAPCVVEETTTMASEYRSWQVSEEAV